MTATLPDGRPRKPPPATLSDAAVSEDGLYRYALYRAWTFPGPRALFVMLNPSTADARVDDATIRACMGYAWRWGLAGIEVVNLYALRSTRPAHLLHHPDPVGPLNALHTAEALGRHPAYVVAAWGAHGHRPAEELGLDPTPIETVRNLAAEWGAPLTSLANNADGSPHHPLYLPADLEPRPWPA